MSEGPQRHVHHLSIVVDLDAIRHNLAQVRRAAPGVAVMGVVKKNAYGHGLALVGRALEGQVDQLGVIDPQEGAILRGAGVRAPILVMGATLPEDLPCCLDQSLEFALLSLEHLRAVEAAVGASGATGYRRARVHLKIDTGMGRIGVPWYDAEPVIEALLASARVELVGVYSHLASADRPGGTFTAVQLERLRAVLDRFEARTGRRPLAHLSASGGILHHEDAHLDMVRPGHLLYGVLPDTGARDDLDLRPAMSLRTRVLFTKRVRAGDPVGYSGRWVAPRDTTISTLSLGYGDGYPRQLTGKGAEVLAEGRRWPVVGSVCMDQTMIDTGDHWLEPGTEVVALGRQGDARIHPHELADRLGTVPDDVLSRLCRTIPRVGSGEGKG